MTRNPCEECNRKYPCNVCPVQIERDARAEDEETERAIENAREDKTA